MSDLIDAYKQFFESVTPTVNATYAEREQREEFSRAHWNLMAKMNLHAGTLSETSGGKNLDFKQYGSVLRQLGYYSHDNGLNFSVMAHALACTMPLEKFGTTPEIKNLLKDFASGKLILCNGMTELQGGSDANNMVTTAEKTANGYKINGHKSFCTNGPVADYALMYAVTDKAKGFFGGITAFLVDLRAKGVTREKAFAKMGLRTATACCIRFDNVLVPDAFVLGQPGAGGLMFQESMVYEKSFMAASHTGTLHRWLNEMVDFCKKRRFHQQPLIKQQSISHMLAEVKIDLETAQALVDRAIAQLNGKNISRKIEAAAVVKYFVSNTMTKNAHLYMKLMAGEGYKAGSACEIQLRDFLACTSYSGTNEIQKNIIASV
ncbi:MAG TPA: acyl-CoA dehydrogenase family protein, partial [Flavobacteriales bacterium]|nr:acyl-CoA dehydrogenase family protein [Flavobacteriales bacterium]